MQNMNITAFQAQQVVLASIDDFPISCGWSCDGARLAVAAASGSIHVFGPDSNKALCEWRAHKAPILQLCWHPLEALLSSSAQDGTVKHWTFKADGEAVLHATLPLGNAWVDNLRWRPDGRFVAASAGKDVFIYSRQGKLVNQAHFPASTVAGIAWSPRGTELAVAGHQYVELLTGAAGTLKRQQIDKRASVLNLRWSPDGRNLAACCHDSTVTFWKLKESRSACMSGFEARPRALAWTPDSRFLAIGGSNRVTAWEFAGDGPEGSEPYELEFHTGIVSALAIHPESGHVAAGGKDHQVTLWESATSPLPYYHFMMEAPVEHLLWNSRVGSSVLAAIDQSGQVGIWKSARAEPAF